MVTGIGSDILRMSSLHESSLLPGDPFLRKTFSEKEIAQAAGRPDTHTYFASRFCGKEAVFKSLGLNGEHVKLCEIEILSDSQNRPYVTLLGEIAEAANKKGISEVLVSLSTDSDWAQAFAIAQTNSRPDDTKGTSQL